MRLWIDDLATLARFAPIDPGLELQRAAGVEVRTLDDDRPLAPLPDVLVAAFGCELPGRWLADSAAAPNPPVVIVLEYLSAESWINDAHGLPSPHPRLQLSRWFFFPGFTPRSGGLLRERALPAARAAFQSQPAFAEALWRELGFGPRAGAEIAVSLFCYPNAALPALLDAWSREPTPVRLVVAQGVANGALRAWIADGLPSPGRTCARGSLQIGMAHFADQEAYDRRLWSCDLNFVRGEDSFVRAQWAARPLVWHAYRQEGRAHEAKIDAFLARYLLDAPKPGAAALAAFTRAFNDEDPARVVRGWTALRDALPALSRHAQAWSDALAQTSDLATRLVEFARSKAIRL